MDILKEPLLDRQCTDDDQQEIVCDVKHDVELEVGNHDKEDKGDNYVRKDDAYWREQQQLYGGKTICCRRFKPKEPETFEEICMLLFDLYAPDSEEAKYKEYYNDIEEWKFKEYMEELAEVYKVKTLAEEAKTEQSKSEDFQTKSEDFNLWITAEERLNDEYNAWKEQVKEERNIEDSEDEIPSWDEWWKQETQARFLRNGRATHERIWGILRHLESKGFISKEGLYDYLQFRDVAFDVFKLFDLHNGNCIFKFKITYDNHWMEGQMNDYFWQLIKDHCKGTDSQEYKDFIEKYRKTNHFMDFHRFQYMLLFAKVNHHLDIYEMQDTLYAARGGRVPCLEDMRAHSIKKQLRNIQPGLTVPIIKNFVAECLHILDIFTDLSLASTMYYLSRDPKHMDGDYNICFVWICLCTFGPYIIQYSTMMNLLYHKGVYQRQKMAQANCCKKFFMTITFTVIGLMVMPFLDMLIKIEALIYMFLIPCSCRKKKGKNLFQKTQQKFKFFYESTFNLNTYEMENYKQQNKYTQMIFEDFLMLVLDVLIFGHILEVKQIKLEKGGLAIMMQIATTIVSVYKALTQLNFESKGLQEYFIIYLLTSMKAKLNWVPLGNRLEANQLTQNMDFDEVRLKKGGMMGSDALNAFQQVNYKFSDLTLKLLTKQLQNAKMKKSDENFPKNKDESQPDDEDDSQAKRIIFNKQPDIKFGQSLTAVTAHQFLNFIDINRMIDRGMVDRYFKFDYIDYEQLVENSKNELKGKKGPLKLTTDFGKPLLQVCMDTDHDDNWPFKELMSLILHTFECDPNIFDYFGEWTMLQCSIWKGYHRHTGTRSYQSFDMFVENCKETLDPNTFNEKDLTTPYGNCLERSLWYPIKKMIETLKIKLDFHKKQVPFWEEDGTWRVLTPIYYFMQRYEAEDFMESLDEMMKSKKWIKFFGTDPFFIEEQDEITQLLELAYKKANLKELITELCQKQIKNQSVKNFYDQQKDDAEKIVVMNNISALMNLKVAKIHDTKKLQATNIQLLRQSTKQVSVEVENKKWVNKCFLEILLTTFIEVSSFFDFFSDMVILVALGNSTDTAWFSFALFTMICPYYTIYTSLTNFQILHATQKIQQGKFKCGSYLASCITVLPTMLIALILVDFGFMFVSVAVYPVLLVFSLYPIGERLFEAYDDAQNNFLSKLFGMSFMEIKGFRCQRTILQFQLESVPQIFFQIYLIIRLKQLNRSQEEFGVSIDAVVFSVFCAFVHVFFEIANLYIEARTSETSVLQYVIACYNSRENWVPRQEVLQQNDNEKEDKEAQSPQLEKSPGLQKQRTMTKKKKQKDLIELDKATLLCNDRISFNIGFKFTEQNLEALFQLISNMPMQQEGQLKRLAVDYCFDDIKPAKIIELAKIAHEKIKLEFEAEKLTKKIENDKNLIELLRNPQELDTKDDDFILIQLAYVKQRDLLAMFIDLNVDFNVDSRLRRKTFVNILKDENEFSTILKIFDAREELQFKPELIQEFRTNFIIGRIHKLNEDHNKQKRPDILKCIATLGLESSQFVPMTSQFDEFQDNIHNQDSNHKNETLVNMASYMPIKMIRMYKPWWGRDARGDPKWLDRFKNSLKKFQKWIKEYPQTIEVYSDNDNEQFDTVFLSKFTKIRQSFINTYAETLSQDEYDRPISIQDLSDGNICTVKDLKNVLAILNGQHKMMSLEELALCDQVVETLGLDKDRAIYFNNSRNYLPADIRKKVIEVVDVSTDNFRYKIPSHVLGVKQLTISKQNDYESPKRIFYTINMGVNIVRQAYYLEDMKYDERSEKILRQTDQLEKLFNQLEKAGEKLPNDMQAKRRKFFANDRSVYGNRFYINNDLMTPRTMNHIQWANQGLDQVSEEALEELRKKPFPSKMEQDICTMCYYFTPWSTADGRWPTVKEKFLMVPDILDKLRSLDYDAVTKEQYKRGQKLFHEISNNYFRDCEHGIKSATKKSKIGGLYIWGWHIDDLPGCYEDVKNRRKVINKSLDKNEKLIPEINEYFRNLKNGGGQKSNQKLSRSDTQKIYMDYFNEIDNDTTEKAKKAAPGKASGKIIMRVSPNAEWPMLKDKKQNYKKFRFASLFRESLRPGVVIEELYAQNYFIDDGFKNWNVIPKFECKFRLEMYKKIRLDGSIEEQQEDSAK